MLPMGRALVADPLYRSPQISVQQNCLKSLEKQGEKDYRPPSFGFSGCECSRAGPAWLFVQRLKGRWSFAAPGRGSTMTARLAWTGLCFLCPFHALISTSNRDQSRSKHRDGFLLLPYVMGRSCSQQSVVACPRLGGCRGCPTSCQDQS